MRPLIRSLRSRLLLTFSFVVLIAIGTVTIFVLRTAEREISEYESLIEQLEMTRMAHWLTGFYDAHHSWDNLQPYLDEMAVMMGTRVVVTDSHGQVVADTRTDLTEPPHSRSWPSRPLQFTTDEDPVGTLHVSTETTIQETFRSKLQSSIKFFLWMGSAFGVAIATILSSIVSRSITAPIRELARCARLAGAGDFAVRIGLENPDREVRDVAEAFNSMAAAIEVASIRRRNLVADTAHELRTPLTNIRGYLEATQDGLVESNAAIPIIEEQVALLGRLVDDLQELALAESGRLHLTLQTEDLRAIVAHVVTIATPGASRKGVSLSVSFPGDTPRVLADAHRVAQVLNNLIMNAITNCRKGDSVTVGAGESPGMVAVSVTDTGPGIPLEIQPFVFDRLYRGDPSRSRTTGGSGLGLTISRYLVEAHGGTIALKSDGQNGSSFTFTLPTAGTRPAVVRGQPADDSPQ